LTKPWRVAKFERHPAERGIESRRLMNGDRRAILGFVMLDRIAGQLERYLDLLSTRQKLVASNIANADTPGYRTRDIDFQGEFQRAAGLLPQAMEVTGLPVKNDGNSVNLDREARLLAENAMRFQVASSLLRSQIQMVRSAIEGGGST
jgi:flagellar basal-body rod protein FlgB